MEKIIHGDCLEVLKEMPDNCVDAVVTDPPYGLSKEPDIYEVLTKWLAGEDYHHRGGGFMNKSWDSFVPGPSVWKEVYRVLKPGGHALVFAGTRTQDLMGISLRMAGFEIRDVIEWLFFSGFPKSLDVSKALDKRKGFSMGGFDLKELGEFIKTYREKAGLSRTEASQKVTGRKTGAFWNWENGYCIPEPELWPKIKKAINAPDSKWDKMFERAEREKIGEKKTKDFSHHKGSMMSKETTEDWATRTTIIDITLPATELAKKWDGWHTSLKPAHEPIILCRKPLDGTVAANVEKWGTGGLNIDGCRIGFSDIDDLQEATLKNAEKSEAQGVTNFLETSRPFKRAGSNEKGRFPANCITTEPDMFYSKYFNITPKELSKKASKKDRLSTWDGKQIESNKHPCIKPTVLMAWLIKLICPPGGIVLDPFAGSGSTLVAAKREGFSFIGIEKEKEYVEISKARIGA